MFSKSWQKGIKVELEDYYYYFLDKECLYTNSGRKNVKLDKEQLLSLKKGLMSLFLELNQCDSQLRSYYKDLLTNWIFIARFTQREFVKSHS